MVGLFLGGMALQFMLSSAPGRDSNTQKRKHGNQASVPSEGQVTAVQLPFLPLPARKA